MGIKLINLLVDHDKLRINFKNGGMDACTVQWYDTLTTEQDSLTGY